MNRTCTVLCTLALGRALPAWATPSLTAITSTKGPVTFTLRAMQSDVQVNVGAPDRVTLRVEGTSAHEAQLVASGGNRIEARFDGHCRLMNGDVHVELPPHSSVDVSTISGDVMIGNLGGEVHVHTTSGDVSIADAAAIDAQVTSGDVRIAAAHGPVRIETVAGDALVQLPSDVTPQLDFRSTDGSLSFTGVCGKGCRLSAKTFSGDLKLALAPSSSFGLSFLTQSGDFADQLQLVISERTGGDLGESRGVRGTFHSGDGTIDTETYSGDLRLGAQ